MPTSSEARKPLLLFRWRCWWNNVCWRHAEAMQFQWADAHYCQSCQMESERAYQQKQERLIEQAKEARDAK